MFPVKFEVSTMISPRTIMTQKIIDYNIYCQILFGAYVQTHEDNNPTNDTEAPRTLAAVSLGLTGNRQGGYCFLNLTRGKRITKIMLLLVICRIIDLMCLYLGSKRDSTVYFVVNNCSCHDCSWTNHS